MFITACPKRTSSHRRHHTTPPPRPVAAPLKPPAAGPSPTAANRRTLSNGAPSPASKLAAPAALDLDTSRCTLLSRGWLQALSTAFSNTCSARSGKTRTCQAKSAERHKLLVPAAGQSTHTAIQYTTRSCTAASNRTVGTQQQATGSCRCSAVAPARRPIAGRGLEPTWHAFC
jgi:hypothetical protein